MAHELILRPIDTTPNTTWHTPQQSRPASQLAYQQRDHSPMGVEPVVGQHKASISTFSTLNLSPEWERAIRPDAGPFREPAVEMAASGSPGVANQVTAAGTLHDASQVPHIAVIDASIYDASDDGLMECSVAAELSESAQAERVRKLRRIGKLRLRANHVRDEAEYQRRLVNDRVRVASAAGTDLSVLGREILQEMFKSGAVSPEKQDELQRAWQLFDNVVSHVSTQAEHLESIGQAWSTVNSQLIRQDNKLKALEEQEVMEILQLDAQSSTHSFELSDGNSDGAESLYAKSGSSVLTDPLEHDYYDALGDVHLAREHLHNFETDHNTAMYERQHQRDTGQVPEQTDDEFWDEYIKQRNQHINDYLSSKKRVERLYEQCKQEGADVDAPNIAPFRSETLEQLKLEGRSTSLEIVSPDEFAQELHNLVESDKLKAKAPAVLRNGPVANQLRVAQWTSSVADSRASSAPSTWIPRLATPGADPDTEPQLDAFAGEKAKRRYSDPMLMMDRNLLQPFSVLQKTRMRSRSTSPLSNNKVSSQDDDSHRELENVDTHFGRD